MAEVVSSQGAKCERIVFGKNDTDFLLITMDNGNHYIINGNVSDEESDMLYYGPNGIEEGLRDLEDTVKFTDESGISDAEVFTTGYDESTHLTVIIRGVRTRGDINGAISADHDADSGKWTATKFYPYGGSKRDDNKFDAVIGKEMSAEELGDRLREIQ